MHGGITHVSAVIKRRPRTTRAGQGTEEPLLALLAAMQAVEAGDFSVQLPAHWAGLEGKLAESFNRLVASNRRLAEDLQQVRDTVGRKGQTRQRITPAARQGAWAGMERSVNELIDDLVWPVEAMTEAIASVSRGDLTRTVPLEADGRPLQGEFLRSARLVNGMIEQMSEFSSEVTRVALEVGTAGKLGGQAKVKGVSGVWKDLTDSVNSMASNLTTQVRNIAEVTTAVARGDLSRKITVDVRGEILELKNTINTMVDQLNGFAAEVTRVAREVGTEGKLGGQAQVPGVAGTWKDLTDNVNQLAANLTNQVRAIADVATAVTQGDLTRTITVDVRGEVEVLCELHRKRREAQALVEELEAANRALLADKARELEALNDSLRRANAELAARNDELQVEIAERRKAEARLREADECKNEFLATLAHELRNPLVPLQNALAIRRITMGEAADPLQDTMERQLRLLVRLVDDLLDVSRITRGKMVLRRTLTPLQAAIECAVDTAQPLIDDRGHTLLLDLPDEPVLLYADPARLSQIFANLLNNAAKYSEPGAHIEVRAERRADHTVAVRVVDRGIGLAPHDLATVFDPFRQVDTSAERAHGGLGIGLTLAQRLARLHGGRIEVHSDGIGCGSTFTVVLPVGEGAAEDNAPARVPVVGTDTPVRVLVVDDNRDAADTLAAMIRLLGHTVDCVYDPQGVEQAVERFEPELVFLDLGMPGRSGYDVARALRQGTRGDGLRLVAVTGWGQPEDHRRTQEAGFDGHLVKPPDLDGIRRMCATVAAPRAAEL